MDNINIECYNGYKYSLTKEDFKGCMFCDYCVRPKEIKSVTHESLDRLREIFGYVPDYEAGKIGNKRICIKCLSELEALLPFKYDDC